MKKTAFFCATLFCSLPALAAEFDATVCYLTSGGYGLRPSGEVDCLRPIFDDSVTQSDFSNLKPADSMTFTGWKIGSAGIEVESISSVSLYKLIGNWKDTKNRYYNFTDYSNVVVYDPASPNPSKTESFNYELYPNSTLRWGLSMTSSKSNRVGLLRQFTDSAGLLHFEICLYENNLPVRKRVCSTLTRLPN